MNTDTLNLLSSRAIKEFEDVQEKYKEYFDKFHQEETKKRRLEAQFKQLKQVSLLAVAEYESLHKQYLTENQYRQHIEESLRKVTEENQEIRKQHKLGANTTIINKGNNSNGPPQETKGELEVLRAMKEAINNELRSAKNEVTKIKEDLLAEQKAHEVTKNHLELGQQQMKQLNRVSVLAFTEFNGLKKRLEVEETNRKTAEDVVIELEQQQKQDERKLSIIKEAGAKDEQVNKFLKEIDQLNETINKERRENNDKVQELQEELDSLNDSARTKEFEEKVSLLMDQLDISQKQVVEAQSRAEKSETDTRKLYVRLAEAERLIDNRKTVPLPPPPPPPPPPIAAPVIRKFITKIGRGRRKGQGEEKEEDPRIEAMTQMIDRIKKGVKLRSVASPAKPEGEGEAKEEEGAMGELAGLLSNMRRGRRGTEDSLDVVEEKKEPEFARLKLKKTGSIQTSIDESKENTTSELKQKLEKQKTIAEGIQEDDKGVTEETTNNKDSKKTEDENQEVTDSTEVATKIENSKDADNKEDENGSTVEVKETTNDEDSTKTEDENKVDKTNEEDATSQVENVESSIPNKDEEDTASRDVEETND